MITFDEKPGYGRLAVMPTKAAARSQDQGHRGAWCGNAVNRMIQAGIKGIEFMVANTDVQRCERRLRR